MLRMGPLAGSLALGLIHHRRAPSFAPSASSATRNSPSIPMLRMGPLAGSLARYRNAFFQARISA
ncbi:MAG TPA: hypothetical protein VGK37_11925, partial [Casimicrobiaceae bacterium]